MVEQDARSSSTTADNSDPGDQTQRNFRYQHAYGAILLTNSAAGKLDYKAIWCEHHDDFLAEISDMIFKLSGVTPLRVRKSKTKEDWPSSQNLLQFIAISFFI